MKELTYEPKPMSAEITLGLSAAVGVTAGVIISLNIPQPTLISLCGISQKLELAAGGSLFEVFLRSFSGIALLQLAAYFLGFCALGQPFEILLTAFRGLGLGLCVRGAYLNENLLLSLAAFLPYAVASTGVLLLCCKDALGLSNKYLRLSMTAENRLGMKKDVRDYTVRFLIYYLASTAFAFADAYLAGALSRL